MKKLIILCDYGLDDAVATTYILDRASSFERIDIVPVAGNFPLSTSFNNAKRILKYYEGQNNIRLVDTTEIPQPCENLCHIHGNDGIGDVLPNGEYTTLAPISYSEWVKTIEQDCTLLSLGPCTVTIDILKKAGSLPLVLMAGNISQTPNYNGYEFNQGLDPDAFAQCVKYPHVCATMDSCHHPLWDFYNIELKGNDLFSKFAGSAVALSKKRNEKFACIYDLVAAYYVFNSNAFDVTDQKDSYGNTVSVLSYKGEKPIL